MYVTIKPIQIDDESVERNCRKWLGHGPNHDGQRSVSLRTHRVVVTMRTLDSLTTDVANSILWKSL